MWRILESPNLDKYDLSSVQRASLRRRAGRARARRAHRAGVPEPAQDAVDRVRAHRDRVGRDRRTAATTTSRIPGSVGRAAPTVELRIVADDGSDVPRGERGEIWIKGPTVMNRGYWHRPDANAAAFTDGWFHTGDIGYLDADGFLYLVDRAKDMIIRAGENVYCVEVEHVLFDHPDVIDAAVVGVPHKTLGEEVKAVVQLQARLDARPPKTSARSAASTSPTSRCRSTSRSATSRCRATRRARC